MAQPEVVLKFPAIDRVVHEPARLAVLSILSGCGAADFLFLENATGLSRGNLSVQLSKLEETGLIKIRKEIVGKKTRTTASLTAQGRERSRRLLEGHGPTARAQDTARLKNVW